MRRGEVWDTRFDPAEGSEQAGVRPAVIVSHDIINASSPVVIVIPCSRSRPGRHSYSTQVQILAPDGGLTANSVVKAEQVRVVAKHRLLRRRGSLPAEAVALVDQALGIALNLKLVPS